MRTKSIPAARADFSWSAVPIPGMKKHPICAFGAARLATSISRSSVVGIAPLPALAGAQAHSMAHFNPAKTKPAQNSRQDRRCRFR